MKAERPINLTADEVRAVLAGRKTQKRFVLMPQPPERLHGILALHPNQKGMGPYSPGDRLWVREKLTRPDGDPWLYAADRQPVTVAREDETEMLVWAHHKDQDFCASAHMPRWASRITLEVADVRIQRVQDISEEDAEAEGVTGDDALIGQISNPFRTAFADIWDSINLKRGYGWDANPWVAAVTWRWLA